MSQKEIQEKVISKAINAHHFLNADINRVKKHKFLMMDMMYMEMEYHAKMLEMFSSLFEET